ncbi:MAG: hypothetical protein ABW151_13545 [Pseudorhodoplanes sp.]
MRYDLTDFEWSVIDPPSPTDRRRPKKDNRTIATASKRKKRFGWKKAIYRWPNHVGCFFNKLKQFRRTATGHDKPGPAFFAFVLLASVRIWLGSIESTSWPSRHVEAGIACVY